MQTVVIGLGIAMVVMFVLVVSKLFTGMQGHATSAPEKSTVFTLAPGAKIVSTETQGDRLILHVRNPSGDEIDIIDTESAKLVGQVKSAPPPR
jgi:hypothetical protein